MGHNDAGIDTAGSSPQLGEVRVRANPQSSVARSGSVFDSGSMLPPTFQSDEGSADGDVALRKLLKGQDGVITVRALSKVIRASWREWRQWTGYGA